MCDEDKEEEKQKVNLLSWRKEAGKNTITDIF